MYFQLNNIPVMIFGMLGLIIEVSLMIRYLNKTNRRLAYFVESIKSEDTSVKFPKDIKNKPVIDLYKNLHKLNDILRDTKIASQYNENLLKTLFEYSYTGFIIIDESGEFEVMNSAARKYLNVTYTSNLKRLKQNDQRLHHLITTMSPGEVKIHRIARDEEHFDLSVSTSDIRYYNRKFKIVSMQDIAKEMDKQELESWHKLFRVITHEIMNSIAPITSLSNTLSKLYTSNNGHKSPEAVSQKMIKDTVNGLKVIDDMSNGLLNFVQNYRQLSKLPKPKIKKIVIHTWLTHLKTLILEMIKDNDIKLDITATNNCKVVYGDESLLNQVMLNLVKNSIDATESSANKAIEIDVYLAANGRTVISVSDNGKGVSGEDLDKVFVPFFTTKENGNGIGMSLSKQIVNMHGGTITVQSEENKGTRVLVLL